LDDGSYFFDPPPAGRAYLVTTAPAFGLQPRLALAGPGASPVGSDAILIPGFQTGASYPENDFLLGNGASGQPLPAGPASVQGFVQTQKLGSRFNLPLAGATLLLRDSAGTVRVSGRTQADGIFHFDQLPTGSYTIAKLDPPGYVPVDAIPGQNGAKLDASTMTVRMVSGLNTYAGYVFVDRAGKPVSSQNSIQGTVSGLNGGQTSPLPGVVVVLQDDADRLVGVTTTGADGQYGFTNLTTGVYRIDAADAPGASGGDAIPGPHAAKLTTRSIQVTMVPDVTTYGENNFVEVLSAAKPGRITRVLAVGDPVPAAGRLGIFAAYPLDPDQNVSAIRRLADDGSLYVADYAGTALLQVGQGAQTAGATSHASAAGGVGVLQSSSGTSRILLDATSQDPVDHIGLARILQVETAHDGTSAIAALRADNQRGIYRLDSGGLTRLGLLPDPADPIELAIADNGQIAFVAGDAQGVLALFQTSPSTAVAGQLVEMLRQGQAVLGSATIAAFSNLTSNAAGDLAVLTALKTPNGTVSQAVVRKSAVGLALAAVTGQRATPGAGLSSVAPLLQIRRPRIGPEGSVVFLGIGDGFTNFFVIGPNRPLQPLHPETNWNPDDTTYDYEVAVDGSVAIRSAPGQSKAAGLRLILPNGQRAQIAPPGARIQPVGQPAFTPSLARGQLFFLAKNLDRPLDPNGNVPIVLCQAPLAGGRPALDANGSPIVTAVAAPGDPVPGHPAMQLLSITQRPAVSPNGVAFGALFGAPGSISVPSAGLFRVPPGGTISDATLLASEGTDLPGADRLALLQLLSYTGDGTLTFSGLLPGAGSVVGTVAGASSPSTAGPKIASAVRIQANQPPTVTPLVAIGQPLDRPDRTLLALTGPLVPLGSDRQLLVARFTQTGGAIGEGLFSVAKTGPVQAIAVTGDPAPGSGGASFGGFSDTATAVLNPPAVSNDGNLVFKARLASGGTTSFGVFQWNGTALTMVGLSNPNPDNLALTSDDLGPYSFPRWSAGLSGSAYLMEQHQTHSAAQVTRLFEHGAGGLSPLVVPGTTKIQGSGAGTLGNLLDYVLDGSGSVFLSGVSGSTSGLMALQPSGLAPMVAQGQSIPPIAGADASGRVFDGTFSLVPDSARGDLVFIAGVAKRGDTTRRGLFKRNATGGIDTVLVEGLGVVGARNVTVDTLASSSIRQTVNHTTASAIQSGGRWEILRTTAVTDSHGATTFTTVVVAQEGQPLTAGAHVVSLDPSALLDLPPTSGPVFALNEAGDVAFLASDGQHWGVYLFSDAGP
jgi:hypothetical protein